MPTSGTRHTPRPKRAAQGESCRSKTGRRYRRPVPRRCGARHRRGTSLLVVFEVATTTAQRTLPRQRKTKRRGFCAIGPPPCLELNHPRRTRQADKHSPSRKETHTLLQIFKSQSPGYLIEDIGLEMPQEILYRRTSRMERPDDFTSITAQDVHPTGHPHKIVHESPSVYLEFS